MLVFLSFSPFFALRGLWTSLDFSKVHDILFQSVSNPHRPEGACPHLNKGNMGSARWLLRGQNWVMWLHLPLQWPMMARGHCVSARTPRGDAGHTRLKLLCISNVSYTGNYPGSRLKYLHRQQSFISRRAHFVSYDFNRALPSVVRLW